MAGIAQIAILARLLGPSAYGKLGLFAATVAILGNIFRLNSAEAAITFFTKGTTSRSFDGGRVVGYCLISDFLTSLIGYTVVAAMAAPIASIFGMPDGSSALLRVYALSLIPLSTYWVSHALLRITDHFHWTFYQTICQVLFRFIGLGILLLTHATFSHAVLYVVSVALLDGALILALALTALKRKGHTVELRLGTIMAAPAGIRAFQAAGHGRAVVKVAQRQIDMLLVGIWVSPSEVGFYRAMKQLAEQVQLPSQGIVASLYPEYSRLWFEKKRAELNALVHRVTIVFAAAGLVAGIMLWFGSDIIIDLLLGSQYLPGTNILRVLMIGTITLVLMTPIYSLPTAAGYPKPAFVAALASLIVQIVGIASLAPRFGAIGAAWASALAVAIWVTFLLPTVGKILRMKDSGAGPTTVLRSQT